jgi:hypothetical protein
VIQRKSSALSLRRGGAVAQPAARAISTVRSRSNTAAGGFLAALVG